MLTPVPAPLTSHLVTGLGPSLAVTMSITGTDS